MRTVTAGVTASTIELPIPPGAALGGFGRHREWNGRTYCHPEANILVVKERSDAAPIALVSVDGLYANVLSRTLNERYDGSVDLLVLASHTHYVPNFAPEFSRLGEGLDEQAIQSISDEVASVLDEMLDAGHSLDDRVSAFVKGRAVAVTSRRRRALRRAQTGLGLRRSVVMMPSGIVPQSPHVCTFPGLSRQVILWTFPCHPTGFFDPLALSSEFIGVVRDRLREQFGSDTVVLFAQGASGDLRQPFTTRRFWDVGGRAGVMLAINGLAEGFRRPDEATWRAWSNDLAESVLDAARKSQVHASPIQPALVRERIASTTVLSTEHPVDHIEISALQLNGQTTLLSINAEVTSGLGASLEEALSMDGDVPVLVTCADESLGYLATDIEFDEGGYESREWPERFGCDSRVLHKCETELRELVRRTVTKLRG